MITPDACLNDISNVIQLALAPAFILTGIAGMLNVMTGRLSRIVDRGRHLAEVPQQADSSLQQLYDTEQGNLEKRRYLASAAIAAGTLSAFLVCSVIFVLFVRVILGLEIKWFVGGLFASSMLSLLFGLTYFLREVLLANNTVRLLLPIR